MTEEEFFRMSETERQAYAKERGERLLRLRHIGFKFHELNTWDWDKDDGFWGVWGRLGLEASYQQAREVAIRKDQQERDDWYRSQRIN